MNESFKVGGGTRQEKPKKTARFPFSSYGTRASFVFLQIDTIHLNNYHTKRTQKKLGKMLEKGKLGELMFLSSLNLLVFRIGFCF